MTRIATILFKIANEADDIHGTCSIIRSAAYFVENGAPEDISFALFLLEHSKRVTDETEFIDKAIKIITEKSI